MHVERDGTTLAIYAPDEATAILFEQLADIWQMGDAFAVSDAGDLTAYNATRDVLRQQRDYWQEQINLVDRNTDPDAAAKIDAAKAKRDVWAAVMRATQRPELPAGDAE